MGELLQNIIIYLKGLYHFPLEQSALIMLVLFFLYFIGGMVSGKNCKKLSFVLLGLLLSFYVSQVIGITLLNRSMGEEARYSLTLFEVYHAAWNGNSLFMTQIVGNIIMFIPIGILVPVCFKRMDGILEMLLVSFVCSLAIETTQLYTHTGLFELLDLINNSFGGIIGFLIYKIVHGICKIVRRL